MSIMNDFLPFADAENATLIPFAEWQNAASRLSGFVSGLASPGQLNRAIAQGANIGYAIAKFIERTLKEDVYVSQPERLVDQFYRAMLEMSYRATPIGCILTFPVQVEIEGFVVSNFGGDLSRTDYAKLFAVYGTKFNVSSTPETKFGIPNLAYNFLEAAGQLAEIGCFVKAGLPNITGHLQWLTSNSPDNQSNLSSGCLSWASRSGTGYMSKNMNAGYLHDPIMNASDSNSIYKDDVATVQVASIRSLCLIRSY